MGLRIVMHGRRSSEIGCYANLALAALCIGTVHDVVRTTMFLSVVAVASITLPSRNTWSRRLVTPPFLLLVLACTATAFQLLPLPRHLIGWLSPHAASVFEAVDPNYTWHALSLDSPSTLKELAKLGAYALLFVVAFSLGKNPRRRKRFLFAIISLAALEACIGFVQALFGSEKIYFLYAPEGQILNEVWVRGTFVNPNHFGALVGVGTVLSLWTLCNEPRGRVLWSSAFLCTLLGSVLSLSRSTWIATVLGCLLVIVHRLLSTNGKRRAIFGTGVALAFVCASAATFFVARSQSNETLGAQLNSQAKFETWSDGVKVIRDYPGIGVGRGSFAFAQPAVTNRDGMTQFQWVENLLLQPLVDWGTFVGGALLLLLLWTFVASLRRCHHDQVAAASAIALLTLGAHDLFDFSLELPGVGFVSCLLLGCLFAPRHSSSETSKERHESHSQVRSAPSRFRLAEWLPLAAMAVVIVLAHLVPSERTDAVHLESTAEQSPHITEGWLRDARAARARHPASFVIPGIVAEALARHRNADVFHWLNDALYLNPNHPNLHLLAAEILVQNNRLSQAKLEYAAALQNCRDPERIWNHAKRRFRAAHDFLSMTPPTKRVALALWLYQNDRHDDAYATLDAVLASDPHTRDALYFKSQWALSRGHPEEALLYSKRLLDVDRVGSAMALHARALFLTHHHDEAIAILREIREPADHTDLALWLAQESTRQGTLARAEQILKSLPEPSDPTLRIRFHEQRALLARAQGNHHQAEWEEKQAARLRR